MGADANGVNVAADDGVHPDRCMLAENYITEDLGGLVDVTACGNYWPQAFKRTDHSRSRKTNDAQAPGRNSTSSEGLG
jgi:hypothetical protein